MFSFKQFIIEKLITFTRRAGGIPKSENVVFLAGGAGSGKGVISSNLLGIDAMNFNVDDLKQLALINPGTIKRLKDRTGVDISSKEVFADLPTNVYNELKKRLGDTQFPDSEEHLLRQLIDFIIQDKDAQKLVKPYIDINDLFSLKNPENVGFLHKELRNLKSEKLKALFKSLETTTEKPNILFDITFSDLDAFDEYIKPLIQVGYKPENIHIVWVVSSLTTAIKMNLLRPRVVPEPILKATHEGTATSMATIIKEFSKFRRFFDGTFHIVFNKAYVDGTFIGSNIPRTMNLFGRQSKGQIFVPDNTYIKLKEVGKPIMSMEEISQEVRFKLATYVPREVRDLFASLGKGGKDRGEYAQALKRIVKQAVIDDERKAELLLNFRKKN
jgi:hypothetical protein